VFNQSIWNDILVLYGKYFEVFFFKNNYTSILKKL